MDWLGESEANRREYIAGMVKCQVWLLVVFAT